MRKADTDTDHAHRNLVRRSTLFVLTVSDEGLAREWPQQECYRSGECSWYSSRSGHGSNRCKSSLDVTYAELTALSWFDQSSGDSIQVFYSKYETLWFAQVLC